MKLSKKKSFPPLELDTLIPLLIGVWRRFHQLSGPPDRLQTREFRSVVQAVQTLQTGLETGDQLIGTDYFAKPDLLGASLLYHWVIHYQQAMRLIHELPHTPRRVLDLASGTAPFACAALRHGAGEVVAIDRNETALGLAAQVCGRYGFPLTVRRHLLPRLPIPVEGPFDLIILGHCLEELFPMRIEGWDRAQRAWIHSLCSLLSPHGHILCVESSLPRANHRLLALRDQLVQEGFAVQAPCVWRGPCPALQSQTPCYAQREFEKPYLIREIQRAAQINLSSLKMSYCLLRHPSAQWPSFPSHTPLYRVVSPPIDTHLGKRYHLCGVDGKRDIGSTLLNHPPELRAFDYLKRGELIAITGAAERQRHFDLVLGARMTVVAPLNHPLPEEEKDGTDR